VAVPLAKQLTHLWQSGESPPDVLAFLDRHAGASARDVIDVVLADQQPRWKTDRPLRVEDYLAKLSEMDFDQPARLALAVGEFRARLASGTAPNIDEFTLRFADLAEPLRSELTALVAGSPANEGELIEATHSYVAPARAPTSECKAAERIGRYRIVRLLGAGSFGHVWLGTDDELERQVAIKVPLPERFRGPEDSQAYLAEARTLATLDHPHIVPVYDVGRADEGLIYVVSKFVSGQNLADRIRERRLSHEESARTIATIAEALHHAHGKGLVHRDIKPANLLIEEATDRPYVADFGLAIRQQDYLGESQFAGTPAYASPEQARGDGQTLDGRSDIFSLGVVFYELLTGKRPFGGATVRELLAEVISRDPTPPRELDQTIPAELERICLHAIAKRTSDRYRTAEDLAADLRAWKQQSLAVAKGIPQNLPAAISPLIGRTREVSDVRRFLADSRLVTLTGPGGIGKTRLGIEVARELLEEFPGGVFLVELAAIRDPGLVASAIAQVIDCHETAQHDVLKSVQEWFGDRRALVLLDNFEQVQEAAGTVAGLLAACPGLKLVITSRAPLRISGEQEYPLPLLAWPDPARQPPLEKMTDYSAVALFVQRAREASPTFQMDQANAGAVAEICARLEGLPLAIELAAAWSKVLPPFVLLERLQNRLKLLTARRTDAPQRQQTLRSAIAWSYDLLSPADQRLFLRLAVFSGGCTLDAAEAILPRESEQLDVLEGIASLVDKSLLRQGELTDGTARFSMLETVREFALSELSASDEHEPLRRSHAKFFVELAEELEPRLSGPDAARCLNRLTQEHANLRAVLEWSLAATSSDASDEQRRELGLRLGGTLWRYWCSRGHLREAKNLLGELLSRAATGREDGIAAKARYAAGCVAEDLGEFADAIALYEEARRQWESAGDVKGVSSAYIALGSVHASQGDYDAASNCHRQALALSRQASDQRGIAVALSNLGSVAWAQGDYAASRRCHEESLAIRRVAGDRMAIAVSLTSLGLLASRERDEETAKRLYAESLEILRTMQNRSGTAVCLNNLAEIACRSGELEEAQHLALEAAEIQQELGDRLSLAYTLESLAEIAQGRGCAGRSVRLAAAAAPSPCRANGTGAPVGCRSCRIGYRALRAGMGSRGPPHVGCGDRLRQRGNDQLSAIAIEAAVSSVA
jgi:predicted ATPase/Tfp pilus assembly protein PilF